MAVAQQRRRPPGEGGAVRGPAGLVEAARDGGVLRHDPEARPGGGRATGQPPRDKGCAGHPRGTAPRPPAYVRRPPALGGYPLHAGVEVARTQHVHA